MKLPEFFGLDIGNHTIKAAQIKHKGNGMAQLVAIGSAETAKGVLTLDSEDSFRVLADQIKKLKNKSKIGTKSVVAALPEASVFSRIIQLPDLGEKEFEEAVYYEAKQYLPTPVSEVQLDYIIIGTIVKDGQNMVRALMVAAPKKVVEKYAKVVDKAGLNLIALETEVLATSRTLTFKHSFESSVLVLDFGATGTDMGVVKGNKLIFSQSLGTGSDALTKAIASDFGLDYQQAEQYKRTYGLQADQAEGKIVKALTPVMQIIYNEINKTINYFRAHLQESTPKKIYIVGDGAKLPGLANNLVQNLGIETQIVDPVANLDIKPKIKAKVAQLSTVGFTVSVGLALKQE